LLRRALAGARGALRRLRGGPADGRCAPALPRAGSSEGRARRPRRARRRRPRRQGGRPARPPRRAAGAAAAVRAARAAARRPAAAADARRLRRLPQPRRETMSGKAPQAALEALIEAHTQELHLPTVRRRFRPLAAEAAREQQTPLAYLAALLEAEVAE